MLKRIKDENTLIDLMHRKEKKVILLMARWSPLAVTIQKLLDFHSKKYPETKFYYVDVDAFDRPKRFFDYTVVPIIKCIDSDGDLADQKTTTSNKKILALLAQFNDKGIENTGNKVDLRRFSKDPRELSAFLRSREKRSKRSKTEEERVRDWNEGGSGGDLSETKNGQNKSLFYENSETEGEMDDGQVEELDIGGQESREVKHSRRRNEDYDEEDDLTYSEDEDEGEKRHFETSEVIMVNGEEDEEENERTEIEKNSEQPSGRGRGRGRRKYQYLDEEQEGNTVDSDNMSVGYVGVRKGEKYHNLYAYR